MLCEMCGQDVESINQVRVEGTILRLCPNCSRFGTVLAAPAAASSGGGPRAGPTSPLEERLARGGRRLAERDLFRELPDMDLAPDWFKRIRIAREKLTWSPEELGKKLNEKKSVVLKMESGSFRPPDTMIPKLEHLLRIRLRADPEPAE
ncbi:MAG: multiprotein-bridging factor 1 family protein [Thermoplasmata archaeon]|nr:multiprotein-bridging factor 1 family protein [Thermoplasmata archaeon]